MSAKSVNEFLLFLKQNDGIGNKNKLISLVQANFQLVKDRTVYYSNSFAVRFSFSSSNSFSNTVLSLSKLQKFDHIPFFVCVVTLSENKLFLANTTFLTKISHSSQQLSVSNIKGSFNGSDIVKVFDGVENTGQNWQRLYAIHAELGFEANLPRLVEATTNISPTGKKFELNDSLMRNILQSVERAEDFCLSSNYSILKRELDDLVTRYSNEILLASHIPNVNIRGRVIEYLIAGNDDELKKALVSDIQDEYNKLPAFSTENSLGDYVKHFEKTHTETDIKTKVLLFNSNPKAYNIDKFLEFHSKANTVFLFYFIGISAEGVSSKALVSVYHKRLIEGTILLRHWAGKNSRGVTQFDGNVIKSLLEENSQHEIDKPTATRFLESLIQL